MKQINYLKNTYNNNKRQIEPDNNTISILYFLKNIMMVHTVSIQGLREPYLLEYHQ